MKTEQNTLEFYVAALVARSQLPLKELQKKAELYNYNSACVYLEAMAKLDISMIKAGKVVDNLTAKTESLFRKKVLTDQRLSSTTIQELKRLIPYKDEREKSTLFIKQ